MIQKTKAKNENNFRFFLGLFLFPSPFISKIEKGGKMENFEVLLGEWGRYFFKKT